MFGKQQEGDSRYGAAQLLRLLLLVAFAGTLFLVGMTTVGFHHIQQRQAFRMAEEEASWLCRSLVREEAEILFQREPGSDYRLHIAAQESPKLTGAIDTFLRPLDILKVKIYDLDGKVIFSTEPGILTHAGEEEERLSPELFGKLYSQLYETPGNEDLAGADYSDRDLIETYVPIVAPGGKIVGTFEIYRDMHRYSGAFAQVFIQAASLVGGLLLLVIVGGVLVLRCGFRELNRAQGELHRLATRDALTGVFSRREIVNRAAAELSRVRRLMPADEEADFSVVLLDLDHFKQINDTHGHPAGDAVLKECAVRIQQALRDFDSVGRYGGEEFLVLLPGTHRTGAYRAAERIRQAISATDVIYGQVTISVTASLGVSACRGQHDTTIQTLLKRADARLYEAKAAGRNCTICRPPLPVEPQKELQAVSAAG